MKQVVTPIVKAIVSDRWMLGLLIGNVLMCIASVVVIGVLLHPSETQVMTHFTSFGSTNYYRTSWTYMLNFMVFFVCILLAHGVLACQLLLRDKRPFALMTLWVSLALLVTGLIIAVHVSGVAALG